jgi:hypothetical protein
VNGQPSDGLPESRRRAIVPAENEGNTATGTAARDGLYASTATKEAESEIPIVAGSLSSVGIGVCNADRP